VLPGISFPPGAQAPGRSLRGPISPVPVSNRYNNHQERRRAPGRRRRPGARLAAGARALASWSNLPGACVKPLQSPPGTASARAP